MRICFCKRSNVFVSILSLGFLIWIYIFVIHKNISNDHYKELIEASNAFLNTNQFHGESFTTLQNELFNGNIDCNKEDFKGYVYTNEDIAKRNTGYEKYEFNLLISDRIGYQRKIPDSITIERCQVNPQDFSKITFKASVVICFHMEAWSTLLRTVFSVVNNTPRNLLHEIILLDDFTDDANLTKHLGLLKQYVPNLQLLSSHKRLGLIKGRILAASKATGDVLVFLDSHCEVNKNWLEHLLNEIEKDKRNVACPVIDLISSHTFEYSYAPLMRGGFNWGLHFSWITLNQQHPDFTKSLDSPTMAGGLFAIHRHFFNYLGKYDSMMNIWGGENLEISFRIWMCGGRLKIVPCSRIGHVFRSRRPYNNGQYSNPTDTNLVRLAETWLDDYKKYFYNARKDLTKLKVDVEERLELRKKLRCKSFKWYLKNVYPEILNSGVKVKSFQSDIIMPAVVIKGKIIHAKIKRCLSPIGNILSKKSDILLRDCQNGRVWWINNNREINAKKYCMDALKFVDNNKRITLMKCHLEKAGQEWIFNHNGTSHIYNPASGMCLGIDKKYYAVMKICNTADTQQKWIFQRMI